MQTTFVASALAAATVLPGCFADGGVRGVAYRALPTKQLSAVVAEPDLVQAAMKGQWGSDAPKDRGDLQIMKSVGANAVRTYHSIGIEGTTDHSAFLDAAEKLGIGVIAGFHTQGYCPNFDCHEYWKKAATNAFKNGFAKDGAWHPAVKMVVLMDQPDYLNFIGNPDGSAPHCDIADEPKCRTRAALSGLDGVLAAEEAAGIKGTANLTVAWSFAIRNSIDNKVTGPGIFGFQDVVAGIAQPDLADYKFTTDQAKVQEAFQKRWVHSFNTASPWSFIQGQVASKYDQFLPTPWIIAEFQAGTAGHSIGDDLTAMDAEASPDGPFLGAVFGQFQHDYVAATKLGMFALGQTELQMVQPCYEDVLSGAKHCDTFHVYCLDQKDGDDDRANQVATAWGGKVQGSGLCATNVNSTTIVV